MKPEKTKKQENTEKLKSRALEEARAVAPQYCEKCGTKYDDKDFHLVQKNNNQSVFHLKCANCSNTYILNVVTPNPHFMASQRSNMNIDLRDAQEMAKYAGQKAVSKDEALDIINAIETQDLESLISKGSK